ncbi:Guanyl-nucleotide exchange factor [Lasiodiplodia theobromae]|uniref:Uncharacterized protein n=1 Tax=Lasiodiplodia theobromae TaxID=45133 RepID=A0A5N5CWL8_9PEZI|nr:Guanyl-nucleotide exchange factor [Lasiodiplodia theobromae]KAB2569757.1 hypothetical protein DBV05_g11570 [Lasiodiplodia theobromae]KAF4539719.1 Guanyl-nucleotide exchange factor [Lasiodiplodia theobromae]
MDSTIPDKAITTPSKSSARRALGELTPNKRISPQKPSITTDKTRNLSPLKQAPSLSLAQDENAHSIPKLPDQMTGRKRSIDEVDSAYARQDATEAPFKRLDARAVMHAQARAPMTSIQASAQLASQIMDLARGDLTPTDEDSLDPAPRGTQETTGTRASFSSLIDYNPHGSSQQTSSSPPLRATKPSAPTVRADSVEVAHHDIRHTGPITQRAEALRLRLRVALYKVRTDQTFVPLSCLEIPEKYRRKSSEEGDAPTPTANLSVTSAQEGEQAAAAPAITVTGESVSSDGKEGVPKLLPAPVLMPTAYSTRFITEPQTTMPSSPPHPASVPSGDRGSSTPRARGSSGLREFVTPVANRHAAVQLSSPPYSEDHGRHRAHDSDSLTSSVVKDRAADALLKLTRSV